METHATVATRIDDLPRITLEPEFPDCGNEHRLDWPATIDQWHRTSVTRPTYRNPIPDNASLRDWARRSNSGPPASWWDADDDPFEPESE